MAVTEVKLPELGEGVSEGELIRWLVKPGDQVKPDQSVAEIMTDKATVEVPTPYAGTIKELKFQAGQVIKVEEILLVLDLSSGQSKQPVQQTSEKISDKTTEKLADKSSSSATSAEVASLEESLIKIDKTNSIKDDSIFPPAAQSHVIATPSTRRLAREMGVNINEIQGTGIANRVTREDVLKIKEQASSESNRDNSLFKEGSHVEERVPLRGIRKKIAENMQMAKSIVPHFTLMDEAEVTHLVAIRESLKSLAEKNKTKITYLPFVMKALISTIREFPMFNASIDDKSQEIVYKKYFNIGFAADTPNGLVVPVIKNADRKTILELSQEILDLSARARDGKLKLDEMKGATITITNIGSVGGTYATPIINHPEVAILGMYKISEKPAIRDGELVALKVMNFTITADHRLIDGAVAAHFMKAFLNRIQNPNLMMVEMY